MIKKVAPRNLLDNSDFTNPVNQRGQTSYNLTQGQYCIDRWMPLNVSAVNNTAELTDRGIIFGNANGETVYLTQRFKKGYFDSSKTYTKVTYFADGTISFGGYIDFTEAEIDIVNLTFPANSIIKWAALYEGEYTIDTLPEYRPKGYGAELAECLRYFERLGGHSSEVLGNAEYVVGGFSSFISSISYYPKRISRPTVQLYDPSNYRLLLKTADTAQVFTATSVESFGDITAQSPFATITANLLNAQENTCWVMLQRADNAPNPYIDICADL